MHKTDIPYINKSNAEMFVAEFLKGFKYKFPNVELKMLIVGGYALAIKHNLRGTIDIDADIRTKKGIKVAVNLRFKRYVYTMFKRAKQL